jgi:hypothetical protein
MEPTKIVKFNNIANLHLIPSRHEINNCRELWWSTMDQSWARFTALQEIKDLRRKHPLMTIKQALKLLYQPNNIRYDPANFIDEHDSVCIEKN